MYIRRNCSDEELKSLSAKLHRMAGAHLVNARTGICLVMFFLAGDLVAQQGDIQNRDETRVMARDVELNSLSVLGGAGYANYGGECMQAASNGDPCESFINRWCERPAAMHKKCVIGIETRIAVDSRGRPKFKAEAAIEIEFSSSLVYLDTSDTKCRSKNDPGVFVVGIGVWNWRDRPQTGGYANPILRAWAVAPAAKRFREISVEDVVCEIKQDRD